MPVIQAALLPPASALATSDEVDRQLGSQAVQLRDGRATDRTRSSAIRR